MPQKKLPLKAGSRRSLKAGKRAPWQSCNALLHKCPVGSGGIDLGLGLDLGGDFRGGPLIGVYEWRTVDSHDRWKGFPNSVLPKFSTRRRENGGNLVEIR